MGHVWGTYGSPCDPHMFPIRSPYVRHIGKISKTTKSYVAHMLSNIWGNLWATQQHVGKPMGYATTYGEHMGKCGHFCIQISSSEHMGSIWGTYRKHIGNIWETYGEHMGSTPKATPNKTSPFLCWCSILKDSQASTKFVLKVCLLSTKMAGWILDRRPELMKPWLDSKLQSLPSASTWCCKREVAVSFFASCAMTKRRRCMKNHKVKPTASRAWGDRSPA